MLRFSAYIDMVVTRTFADRFRPLRLLGLKLFKGGGPRMGDESLRWSPYYLLFLAGLFLQFKQIGLLNLQLFQRIPRFTLTL